MSKKLSRKAINFDLDTAMMNAYGVYPSGYQILQREFEKAGYTHRQGSGYVSNEMITHKAVSQFIEKITTKYEWFGNSVSRLDVTDIGNAHDFLPTVNKTLNKVWKDRPIPTPLSVKTSASAGAKRERTSESKMTITAKTLSNEEKIIRNIKASKYGSKYEDLMQREWKNGNCPKQLLNIATYFSYSVIKTMAVDVIESIVNKSEQYNGDRETLHKQVTAFVEEWDKKNYKQENGDNKHHTNYNAR